MTRRHAALLTAIVIAPALAACGAVSGSTATQTPSPETSTVTVTASPSPASPTATSASLDSVSEGDAAPFIGTWEGSVDQPGAGDYDAILTIAWDSGTLMGTAYYPQLKCSGHLSAPSISGFELSVTEHISSGSGCVAIVPLTLTVDGATMDYRGPKGLTASLTKVTG